MDEFYNKHYILIDASSRIIDGFSDAFRSPTEDAICINDKGGYQFALFGIENPPLFDGMSMIPLYKYEDGTVKPRTEEELAVDREAWAAEQARIAAMPTQLDRIEAQTTYTAMMTDTLLED